MMDPMYPTFHVLPLFLSLIVSMLGLLHLLVGRCLFCAIGRSVRLCPDGLEVYGPRIQLVRHDGNIGEICGGPRVAVLYAV